MQSEVSCYCLLSYNDDRFESQVHTCAPSDICVESVGYGRDVDVNMQLESDNVSFNASKGK